MASSSLLARLLLKRAPPPFLPLPSLPLLTTFNNPFPSSSHSVLSPSEIETQTKTQIRVVVPIFPSFPHLDPIWHSTNLFRIGEHVGADPVMHADSVKKKRKRKMNKHKLRKLRKVLRLRT